MTDKPSVFVATITKEVIEKLRQDLTEQGFELSIPPYTHFSAKKKGLSCTLYTSLKLTVQGKDMANFIEFYLEPEILKTFNFTYKKSEEKKNNTQPRIGVDEAGKGDFFGPLCVGALFATAEQIEELISMGIKDSKKLSDKEVLKLSHEIQKKFHHSIIRIGPAKYNELYSKFRNLNSLLAWGHATAIENLVVASNCRIVIIDQFAHESVVQRALQHKKIEVELTQRHRGEEDIVVAAASILARAAFLEGLAHLSKEVDLLLPKGASSKVIEVGKVLVAKYGAAVLNKVSKEHFRTTLQVLEMIQ